MVNFLTKREQNPMGYTLHESFVYESDGNHSFISQNHEIYKQSFYDTSDSYKTISTYGLICFWDINKFIIRH